MSRELKFKVWDRLSEQWVANGDAIDLNYCLTQGALLFDNDGLSPDYLRHISIEIVQFSGLLDKNGVEIYEFSEINNKYTVTFQDGQYILVDISTGDRFQPLNRVVVNGYKIEVTGEYAPIQEK